MGARRAGGGRERREDGGRAAARGGPRTPGPSALRARGSWRRRSGAAGPGVGGGRTARGGPGKELAAAASPKPAPLPSLGPPSPPISRLPFSFRPPCPEKRRAPPLPLGRAAGAPPGLPSHRGPGTGARRGFRRGGGPEGVRLPLPVALGLSQLPREAAALPKEGGETTKTGFPSLRSWSCWLVPERVCLRRPKMAFKVYF